MGPSDTVLSLLAIELTDLRAQCEAEMRLLRKAEEALDECQQAPMVECGQNACLRLVDQVAALKSLSTEVKRVVAQIAADAETLRS